MPEDKDFKRLVRARMADQGERYTTARAQLRPEGAAKVASEETAILPKVVPMDLARLEAWRSERPRPTPGQQVCSFGTDWELAVDAGGPVDVLEPPAVEVTAVASLGRSLGGVGYLAFGLHVVLPAPAGSDPDDPKPPPMEERHATLLPLQEAQAELHRLLGEHLAIQLPHPNAFLIGRPRRQRRRARGARTQHDNRLRRGGVDNPRPRRAPGAVEMAGPPREAAWKAVGGLRSRASHRTRVSGGARPSQPSTALHWPAALVPRRQ